MEDDLPRNKNNPLELVIKQDLDPFSVNELELRIEMLKSEITRCETKKDFAISHRASADDLFKKS